MVNTLQLGYQEYGPAEQVTYDLNENYPQLMDDANLTVSFVVPPSGRVFIDVSMDWGIFGLSGITDASDLFMAVTVHGTNAGTAVCAPQSWGGLNTESAAGGRATHRYNASGLTPGFLQVDLAMGVSSTADFSASFYATKWDGTTAINDDPHRPGADPGVRSLTHGAARPPGRPSYRFYDAGELQLNYGRS